MYNIIHSSYDDKLGKFVSEKNVIGWNTWRKASKLFAELVTSSENNAERRVGFVSINYNDEVLVSVAKHQKECRWWFNPYERIMCDRVVLAYNLHNTEAA